MIYTMTVSLSSRPVVSYCLETPIRHTSAFFNLALCSRSPNGFMITVFSVAALSLWLAVQAHFGRLQESHHVNRVFPR